ncbi:Formin Homology 2 Domain [Blomia tropicalis]|nr:Formin Homology 2 Domain [Blomia tropicalis]
MSALTCKVQYLNDVDPFSACTKFPEPTRPPLFTFNVNIPLINQIAAVHRLLKAPHRKWPHLKHWPTNGFGPLPISDVITILVIGPNHYH